MEIGQVYAFLPGRPVAPAQTVTEDRNRSTRPVEEVVFTVDRASERQSRPVDRVVEGELLQRERPATQSTQDFLSGRRQASDSAQSQREATRNRFSSSNRQAVGLYLNNIRPEPRQALTQGQSVDTYV